MADEVPDLSAGPKVSEVSHAAMAALQIASSRRDAAARAMAERMRDAEAELADFRRAQVEWRRLADTAGRAGDQLADSRFDAALAERTAALSRQRHDGAILEYQEALDAPAGAVPRWRLDALEKAVSDTSRQSDLEDGRAHRAGHRHQRAAAAYQRADEALRAYESEHGIVRATGVESGSTETWDAGRAAVALPGTIGDAEQAADMWRGVLADEVDTPDAPETVLDETELGLDHARAAAGQEAVQLADADAAAAAADAHRLAFPATSRSDDDLVEAAAPVRTGRTAGRARR